jgi:hypothetical protein
MRNCFFILFPPTLLTSLVTLAFYLSSNSLVTSA